MKVNFEKFFSSDRVMKVNAALSIIVAALSSVLMLTNSLSSAHIFVSIMDFFLAFCVIVIVKSYFAHEKNVMKGMMGFLLASCLFAEGYQLNRALFTAQLEEVMQFHAAGIVYIALQCLAMLLFVIITVSHFIINSEHNSRPKNIRFNQVIIMVEAFVVLIEIALSVRFFAASNPVRAIFWSLNYMMALLCLNSIICIESKLDAYKMKREAAAK